MKISIIIVSWNVQALLEKCLSSIKKYTPGIELEVIVCDNASSDDTVTMVRSSFPDVTLIANTENKGFAAANNQAILQATGEYILLLNPDTELVEESLAQAVSIMENQPEIGIIGCKHLNPDYTLQPSVRRSPTLLAIALIISKIAKFFPKLPPLQWYLARDFDYDYATAVEQVAGSWMFIRRDVFDRIGLLDEKFFIWFEEVDLCTRARAAGFVIWYTPDIRIMHYGGQSFKQQLTVKKQQMFIKSAWYYFSKHGI